MHKENKLPSNNQRAKQEYGWNISEFRPFYFIKKNYMQPTIPISSQFNKNVNYN